MCKMCIRDRHLIGLLSDGGVHSHNTHLYALLEMAKKKGLKKVYVHCLLDGRDVPPNSGANYVAELEAKIREIGCGSIATIAGRYYGMDRDNRWERVEKAYNAIVMGEGEHAAEAVEAVKTSYSNEVFDEFVLPTVLNANGTVEKNDSVIFFNFRPDRARDLTRCFVPVSYTHLARDWHKLSNGKYKGKTVRKMRRGRRGKAVIFRQRSN